MYLVMSLVFKKKLLQEESRALCVHCRAHKLNLAVQDAMNVDSEIRDFMLLVQELTAFVRGSPKRLAWFSQFKDTNNENQAKSSRPFCPTRCTMRLVSLQTIASNYISIVEWLGEVDSTERNATGGVMASGYSKSLKDFNSFFLLEILRMVLTIVEGGNLSLQDTQLSFCKSEKVIQCIGQSVIDTRTDDRFSKLWQSILSTLSFWIVLLWV